MDFLSTNFSIVINIKFRENPSTGNRVDKFVGTRMTKVTGAFRDYARASTFWIKTRTLYTRRIRQNSLYFLNIQNCSTVSWLQLTT